MARPHPHKRVARAAAISILSLIGAVLAVWAAPRVSDAVAAWASAPPVESVSLTLPGPLPVALAAGSGRGADAASGRETAPSLGLSDTSATPVIDPGMRFTLLGVTCRPPARTGGVAVLLRTSLDGRSWSRWYRVELERAAEQGGDLQTFTDPIWTGAGRYIQVSARRSGSSGTAPARLRDVSVFAINSTEDADRGAVVAGVLRRAVAAIAGIDPVPAVGAMTKEPRIVSRKDWGANESWRTGSPSFAPVKMAFIHHTDSGNSYSAAEAPAIVRAVYHYHTKALHWSDVGYNFLIDRYGTIYEGRYGGITKGALGAQTLGFNTGSTGISVIGTFTSATPPSAAVTSLERLLEWKLDVHHVDPQGTATLVCGYGEKYKTGQRVTFPVIAGHRDANYTDCPGGRLYRLLPEARRVAARTGQPKIYGYVIGAPAISPNGDDVRDQTTIGFTVSETAAWRVEIRDAADKLVQHLAGDGTVVATTWSGKGDDGRDLPDGLYTVEATATSASGEARPATDVLRIDTVAPKIVSAEVTPDPFSPNGDGHDDLATLAFEPAESGTARVSVVSADGDVLRRVSGWKTVAASEQQIAWDGRVRSGGGLVAAPEGPAILELEVRDLGGNVTTLRRRVTVDRTIAFASLTPKTISPNGDGRQDSLTLGFKLSRAAQVTAAVVRAGDTVQTTRLGNLAAGGRSVAWDGLLSGGDTAASGAYQLLVTADGALGVTSIVAPVTVDLVAPTITAPASVASRYRRTAKIAYKVRDRYSPTVRVLVKIRDAKNRPIASVSCGWVKQGTARVFSWKPRRRGAYTLTFTARDRGGNRQAAVVKTSLRVR